MSANCFDVCKIINCYGSEFEIIRLTGYNSSECSTVDEPVYATVVEGVALLNMRNVECTEALIAFCLDVNVYDGDIINIGGSKWVLDRVIEYPSHIEARAKWTN